MHTQSHLYSSRFLLLPGNCWHPPSPALIFLCSPLFITELSTVSYFHLIEFSHLLLALKALLCHGLYVQPPTSSRPALPPQPCSEGLEGVSPSTCAESPSQSSVRPGREALPAVRAARWARKRGERTASKIFMQQNNIKQTKILALYIVELEILKRNIWRFEGDNSFMSCPFLLPDLHSCHFI